MDEIVGGFAFRLFLDDIWRCQVIGHDLRGEPDSEFRGQLRTSHARRFETVTSGMQPKKTGKICQNAVTHIQRRRVVPKRDSGVLSGRLSSFGMLRHIL